MPTIASFYGIAIQMFFDDPTHRISMRAMAVRKRW